MPQTAPMCRVRGGQPLLSPMRWLGFCAGVLLAGAAQARSILELDCAGQRFSVEARAYAENAAGSSQVDLRYRYRDHSLTAIPYEHFHHNLNTYLQRDAARTREFGLRLDTSGASRTYGYEQGDSLYLPPELFTAAEFEQLAACIERQHPHIRRTFAATSVNSSTFLGLMKTRTKLPVQGIARLIHAAPPIVGLYGGGSWHFVLIEAGGRVLVHSNFTANNPPAALVLGKVRRRADGRLVIQAPARYQLHGNEYETRHLLVKTDRHGRRLQDDYQLAK